jgi:hypothetical protein
MMLGTLGSPNSLWAREQGPGVKSLAFVYAVGPLASLFTEVPRVLGSRKLRDQNLQTAEYLEVPKGTAHKDEAMRLIAYCVSAENNHRLSEFIEYAPINEESISKVDPQVAPQLPTAHRDVGVTYNAQWWDNNREAVTNRFNEWVTS